MKDDIATDAQVYSTGWETYEGSLVLSNNCCPVVHSYLLFLRGDAERWPIDESNLRPNIPFGPRFESVIILVLSIPSSDAMGLVTADIVL